MLAGKKILVTGAASGIGRATAKALKEQGAIVLGADVREMEEEGLDERYQVNLLDPLSIMSLAKALPTDLDGLCNVAGLPPTFARAKVLLVNFLALRMLTTVLIDKMKAGASVVNVASAAGAGWARPERIERAKEFFAIPFNSEALDTVEAFLEEHEITSPTSYLFSKELVVAWTVANAWKWREKGIRINAVSPGPVDTPILQPFLDSLGPRATEAMLASGRPGSPTEVADLIVFLQSDTSKWISGTNIEVDGGLQANRYREQLGLTPDA